MPAERTASLIERLGSVRGELAADVPLARYTWFKTGGPADVLFRPADFDDLVEFLARLPKDVPLTMIGNASNLLVRDGGIDGVVIRLGRAFSEITRMDMDIIAGGGVADLNIARKARDEGLAGLEFLAGVPGTLGGAVAMNAGAYGREIADVFVSATIVARDGTWRESGPDAMGFAYRHSTLGDEEIITGVRLRGEPGDRTWIAARMDEIQREREAAQPVRSLTGGSTFKNPDGHKAWELIDAAGCRGCAGARPWFPNCIATFWSTKGAPRRRNWKAWAKKSAAGSRRTRASFWSGKSGGSAVWVRAN